MNKEISVWVQGLNTEGTILRECHVVAFSQYDFLQKVLRRCIEFSQDERVYTLVFTDVNGTEQYTDALFFREGKFEF